MRWLGPGAELLEPQAWRAQLRDELAAVEAGPRDRNPWIHIPMGFGKLVPNPNVNWGYETEPEPNLNNRRIEAMRFAAALGPGLAAGAAVRGDVALAAGRRLGRVAQCGAAGGGVGTAGVMTQRGKDIRLERGQHLKIRTSTDTSAL